MSIEIIREYDLNGEYVEKIVDCTPVENFVEDLEASFRNGEYHSNVWKRIDALKKLDYEQLLRAASQLMCIASDYAQGYDFLLTRNGVKITQDLLELRDKAKEGGVDLWPELDK